MTTYRMKHIPTGLYYCPARKIQVKFKLGESLVNSYPKSNLSKKGKVYLGVPSIKWISDMFYDHTLPITKQYYSGSGPMRKFISSEWEIEEV